MKTYRKKIIVLVSTILFLFGGCSEDFLEPKPMSFFSPENVLVNKEGMESLLTTCEHLLRLGYTIPQVRIEFLMLDIATMSGTNLMDFVSNIYPSSGQIAGAWYNIQPYWYEWYTVIKYANSVISRIDDAEFANDNEKNAILARAYFFRARSYFRLAFQFGDVPLVLEEVTTPRLDFYTFSR